NVISGNALGVALGGSANVVQGNYIGTDLTGTAPLGNAQGVAVQNGMNDLVGGTAAGARNLISGNNGTGIFLSSNDNLVQGNYTGTHVSGTVARASRGTGVVIRGSDNLIGGTAAAAANTIAFNGRGVQVDGGTGNGIRRNAIFSHAGLGIELINGGNHLQPF